MGELAQERGQAQKLENSKMLLERQNKELRAKLQELETSQRAKAKATIAALESKIAQLDETEEEVSREKAQRRKIQRELEDLMQDNEAKDREITNLKNKLRGMGTLGSSSSRRRAEREREFL